MKILVAAAGRLKDDAELSLVRRYEERIRGIGRGVGITGFDLREIAESRAGTGPLRKAEEATRLLALLPDSAQVVALDETGRNLTSAAFAQFLRDRCDEGCQTLGFLIGGPDGHGQTVLDRARLRLALGTMTLPHALARIVLVEQIYRAATILAGHPYHRA